MRLAMIQLATISMISMMLILGCSSGAGDKIPITTSSKEARADFLKGRDLFERLQGQESLQYLGAAIEKDPDFAMAYLFNSFK